MLETNKAYKTIDSLTMSNLRRQFRKNGLKAFAFDIKLNVKDDIMTSKGFYRLLEMAMSFLA